MVWSECSRNGIPNCYHFFAIQEETLLEQQKNKSASAYDYLEKSNGAMAQYTMDYNTEITTTTVILPPWYGVVTSNTSECIIQ